MAPSELPTNRLGWDEIEWEALVWANQPPQAIRPNDGQRTAIIIRDVRVGSPKNTHTEQQCI